MRDNKFLKQQSDIEKQRILEEGKNQKYEAMLNRIKSAPQKQSFWKRYSKWLISAAGVAASAIILVCVFVFYPFAANTSTVYLEENLEVHNSTLDEMAADMKEYEFNFDTTSLIFTVNKTIDKISGDTLFYTVKTTGVSQTRLTFVAVCNPNYTYPDFEITDDFIHTEIPNYSITYMQMIASGGIARLSARAKIQRNKEIIYLTDYQAYLLDSNRTIIDIIQEMFI